MSAGDTLFTLLGFCGVYLVVGLLFLYLVGREVMRGPLAEEAHVVTHDSAGPPHEPLDPKPLDPKPGVA